VGIGISIFLIAVGAVLYFAVSATAAGVSISTVGVVLMLIGGLGLVVSFVMIAMARSGLDGDGHTTIVRDHVRPVVSDTTVVREEERPVIRRQGTTVVREEVL
jgi:hypothetical protein